MTGRYPQPNLKHKTIYCYLNNCHQPAWRTIRWAAYTGNDPICRPHLQRWLRHPDMAVVIKTTLEIRQP